MAAYEAIGDLSEDGDAIADAMRAEADTIVFEATEDHGRLADVRPGGTGVPGGSAAADPHPLQHRAAGVRPVRDGARRRPGRPPRRAGRARLGRRDPAVPAGRAAHGLGAGPGRRAAHADPGRGRRPPDGRGEVDVVLVGADRIAANGDTANKVGTYTLAVLAARHGIPFYVVAPISTVDLATPDGGVDPDRGAQGATRSCSSAACASPRRTPRSATPPST